MEDKYVKSMTLLYWPTRCFLWLHGQTDIIFCVLFQSRGRFVWFYCIICACI